MGLTGPLAQKTGPLAQKHPKTGLVEKLSLDKNGPFLTEAENIWSTKSYLVVHSGPPNHV